MNEERLRAARARLALRQVAPAFLFDPAYRVGMLDYGTPIREDSDDLRPTLRFHVPEKLGVPRLEAAGIKPVPRQIGEFTTDVIEGSYRPHVWPWWPAPPRADTGNPRAQFTTLRGGISISDLWHISAGTLGGLVRDRASGDPMILSNWHVLVVEWWARAGQGICQPGRLDGGSRLRIVARLTRDAMHHSLDAAVATLAPGTELINHQLGIGPVTGGARPQLGMRVTKSGRTTGVTHGMVTGVDGYTRLWYGSIQRIIRHVVTIVPVAGPQVSAPGDSGSWWLDAETMEAVGLHFAGSDAPEIALAMDMLQVLDALGVEVVTERPAVAQARRSVVSSAALVPR